jgi:hypothetical protein
MMHVVSWQDTQKLEQHFNKIYEFLDKISPAKKNEKVLTTDTETPRP